MNDITIYLLNQFFGGEFYRTIFIILLSILTNIFQINIVAKISANIIDAIEHKTAAHAYTSYKFFIGASIVFIFLFYFYKLLQAQLLSKLRQWLKSELIKITLIVNNENMSDVNFSTLSSPINRISSNLFYIFNQIFSSTIPNLSVLSVIFGYLLFTNLTCSLIFFIGNACLLLYIACNWNNMCAINNIYEKTVYETENALVEIMNNVDKILNRGQNMQIINDYENLSNLTIEKSDNVYINVRYHAVICSIIVHITLFILIGYLIKLAVTKKINVNMFITFFTIMIVYRDKIVSFIQDLPAYVELSGRNKNIMHLFQDMEGEYMRYLETDYVLHNLAFNTIQLKNVSFKYKSQPTYIIENLNLTLTLDKIIGITGLSGKGKSTFVKLILKTYKYEGDIFIDGINVNEIDGNYIRQNIIYVNQNSKLFDKLIIENIHYGCNDLDNCEKYLDEIMQFEKIKNLFKGINVYTTTAGLAGENLSGGQRQIINIINGLIIPSEVTVLDEPTNALDPELKLDVIKLIKHFKQYKKCIIIISHDKDIYSIFDETIKL